MCITLRIYLVSCSPIFEAHKYINPISSELRIYLRILVALGVVFCPSCQPHKAQTQIPVTTKGAEDLWYIRERGAQLPRKVPPCFGDSWLLLQYLNINRGKKKIVNCFRPPQLAQADLGVFKSDSLILEA